MNKGIAIGIAFLIGLGLLLFFTRKAPAPTSGCATCGQPLRLQLATGESTNGMLHYKNKETRIIEWDKDLVVPTKFVIEREYYQLP